MITCVIPLVMEFSQNYPSNSYETVFVLIVAAVAVVVVVVVAAVAVVVAAVIAVVVLYLTFYCNPIAVKIEN